MNKYQSHKIVEAGIVTEFARRPRDYSITVEGDRTLMGVSRGVGDRISEMANEASTTVVGGALMQYPDGYMSWSPRGPFEDGYREIGKATFSSALGGVKRGEKWARSGWNGKDMFIFLVPGSHFKVNRAPLLGIYPEGTEIDYHAHIDMRTAQGQIVPWLASQSDMIAEDWAQL